MEWLDLIIRIFVIGVLGWAIQRAISYRIKAIEDKIPLLPDCHVNHKEVTKEAMEGCVKELNHVRELIVQELKHGDDKFAVHTKAIEEIKNAIQAMQISLAEIARNGRGP
jgi:hypothetical protein